jgi:hypothetical protein
VSEAAYLTAFAEDAGYLDFARVGPPSRQVVAAGTAALAGVSAPMSVSTGWAPSTR